MRTEQWLGTVKARIVWLTLLVAWALSLFLTDQQTVWLDWTAFVLLFWTVYQPARISFVLAFILGIVVDVQQSSVLGEHALIYVGLIYAMRLLSPRLQFASIFIHALYGSGLLAAAQLLRALVHLIMGGEANVWQIGWIGLGTVVWMLLAWLLTRGVKSRMMGAWMML